MTNSVRNMALPEKTKIWSAIKAHLSAINQSGSNGIEVLMWSQDKGLEEVRQRLRELTIKAGKDKNEEEQKETDEHIAITTQSADQRS